MTIVAPGLSPAVADQKPYFTLSVMPQASSHYRMLHLSGQDRVAGRNHPIDRRIEFIGKEKSQTDRHAPAYAIDLFVNVGNEETEWVTTQLKRVRQRFKRDYWLIYLVRIVGFQRVTSLRSFGRRSGLNPVAELPTWNLLDRCTVKVLGAQSIISEATIQIGHGEGHARRSILLIARFDRKAVGQAFGCYHEPATS
ncbi:hypothetical protein LT699_11000 [Pseudomonas syringae pv. syringae]|uniref:hypothetical protein n=1 Tax=Pseudomonas syringae TaxID=317 RepID=UPI00200A2031|nr:hypothetical protein [Pseudomonas syringae]MCK9747121.1 hypothetical protein [Pseudomonas syringae pv. syringae]